MDQPFRVEVSEQLQLLGKVDCALFTTFVFVPSFFERNILPAIFNIQDVNEVRRRLLVNERLATSPCAVFYDSSQDVTGGENYRYQTKGVGIAGRFFHPKNIIVAGYNNKGIPLVFVSAASANLTHRAWARNEEAYAFLWITSQKQQAYNALQEFCTKFLRTRDKDNNVEALEKMINFLKRIPDGNNRMPEYDGELYFSPLMKNGKGFPEFINKDAERKRKSLTVYSPYWGKEVVRLLKLFKADSYVIRPSYFEASNSYGLNKQQLQQIKNNEQDVLVEKESRRQNKEYRFRHAKMYLLESSMSDKVRLGIGSCNCTDPGLSGAGGHIESMIVLDIDTKQAYELTGPGSELSFDDVDKEFVEEEEVPGQPPFLLEVILDWKTRKYLVDYKVSENSKVQSFRLSLPGVTGSIDILQNNELSEHKMDGDPKTSRMFVATYAIRGCKDEIKYHGLIFEVNLLHSQRDYFPKLKIQDILDSWRHRDNDDHWVKKAGEQDDPEDPEDMKNRPETIQGQQAETGQDILGYYDIYRGFFDLRSRFMNSVDQDVVDRFFVARPDSLYTVISQIPDSELDLATRFIIMKECEILAKYIERQPGIKMNSEFMNLLHDSIEIVRNEMDKALVNSEKDKRHLKRVGAKEAREWFEKEMEKCWK